MQVDRWGLDWEKENRIERVRHLSGLTKRYKEVEVDRQEIETNICEYTSCVPK